MKTKTEKKQFVQYVISEPDNSGSGIEKFVSDHKLTLEEISKYYEDTYNYDWERDSITLVDEPETIKLP